MNDTQPADADRPRFARGARVRVRAGVIDPDYPDIPLGGWTGKVAEVDAGLPPLYLIEWDEKTLAEAHPVYRRRCDRDGLEVERAWIGEADLLPDHGPAVAMEQPTELRPRPLRLDDPTERALSVLGLTSDDELPRLTQEGLARFHAHLSVTLRFPFVAGHDAGTGQLGPEPILVLRLLPPEQALPDVGLTVEASLGGQTQRVPLLGVMPAPDDPAFNEIAAYAAWVAAHHDLAPALGPRARRRRMHPFVLLALVVGVLGAIAGSVVGAAPEAVWAAGIAAGLLGAVGAALGGGYELLFRRINRLPPSIVGGAALGLMIGGGVGGWIGTVVYAYLGAIPGAIVGTLLSQVLAAFGVRWPWAIHWTLGGACLGVVGYAYWMEPVGAVYGSLLGGLLAALWCGLAILAGIGYLAVVLRER